MIPNNLLSSVQNSDRFKVDAELSNLPFKLVIKSCMKSYLICAVGITFAVISNLS